MEKPVPQPHAALDYHQCRDYLQEKYKYNENDYARRVGKDKVENAPYLNFWHFLIEWAEISNGAFFEMHDNWTYGFAPDDYRKIILKLYFKEFGEGKHTITFWVEW